MDREIRLKIGRDGKVEIDSSIFEDCKDVAAHLTKILGTAESFTVKDEFDREVRIKVDTEK
ncbi:MAG: hypothetical protein OEV28_01440 [Nitrospirota bacterium]|nr:hypothetical protein [Nitrospirota bacterium]